MQPPISIGTVLQSRYRVLSILGQGGFGRTYLAEDQGRFNELCALKELIPPQTGEYALEKSRELFQREAQTLYQIQHPQIPQFRATFEQDQRLFLVQDYVAGKTYRTLLDERKTQGYVLAEGEVIQLMQQVLPVLAYLHGKGIIHRDIAPDNIILRELDRLPVLIDFGVVKELVTRIQTPDTLKQSTTVGKLGYAPIEQMQTGRAYPNSDLYALAVTAVVLLTGREPQELLDDSTMTWHWQRWCQVTPAFAQVINRMLSYTPSQRYQSSAEVLQALQLISSGAAPQTMPLGDPNASPTVAPNQPSGRPASQMATIAVGRPPERTEVSARSADRETPSRIPEHSSLWDDPWAVALIALGVVALTGIGSWAFFKSLRQAQTPPSTSPSPEETVTASPKPTQSASPKPSPSPVSFSQKVDLSVDKPVSRTGQLLSNQTLTFNLIGKQGQTLSAALRGEGVLLTVIGPDGQPVNDRAKRVSDWEGNLPFNGEYSIQLKTVQGLAKADFTLDLKLRAPVVPSPSPSPSVTPSPTTEPTPPTGEVKSERIVFEAGQTSVQVQGSTDGKVVRRYLVNAQAGQTLSVALQGGGTFSMRAPNEQPIDDASGITSWQALLPQAGDYQIDVISDKPAEFTLSVGLK